MRLLGGKKLLEWKDPQSAYKAHQKTLPVWKRILFTAGLSLGGSFLLAFCGLIGETAEHGDLTWDSIRLILMLSLPLGLIFAFLFVTAQKSGDIV